MKFKPGDHVRMKPSYRSLYQGRWANQHNPLCYEIFTVDEYISKIEDIEIEPVVKVFCSDRPGWNTFPAEDMELAQ